MSAVILKITYDNGDETVLNIGFAETKYGAVELLKERVRQFHDKNEREACKNTEYYDDNGEHIFTCNVRSGRRGGKKSRKSRKSRKTRKSRKSRRFRK